MTDEKNALAELAKDLKAIADWTEGGYGFTAIAKAQRIVAELAKVGNLHNNEGWPPEVNPRAMVLNCRAIAEEGAGDGK